MSAMGTIEKHISLFRSFLRASVIADLEYRMNFLLRIVTDVFWYCAQISVFEVLFRQSPRIGGWTLEETRVFLGLLFLSDAIWMMLFSENLDHFSDKVRKGDLDLLLAKPVNSQFMMSFQRINTAYVGNLLLGLGWLTWSLMQIPSGLSVSTLIWLVITIPCSIAITYALRFFFSASAIIFTRTENINYLWYQFYKLGTRPESLYPTWLRYIILSAIPVGFIASVPAELVLGRTHPLWILAMVGLACGFILISRIFWNYALRHYTSASS